MRNKLYNKLRKRPFIRNVMIVASGTALAQLIALALTPIITRLYGPEAYGLLGVFRSIIGIVTPIAALTYPIAIVLPKNKKDAKGLVFLSLIITLTVAGVVGISLLFFQESLVQLFKIEVIASYLFLIPIVIVFAGFRQVAEQWLIRAKKFGITAKVTIIHVLFIQGGQVGFGLFNPIATVLIITTALGDGLKAFMMFKGATRASFRDIKNSISYPQIIQLAKKYSDFPVFRAPEVFINAVSQGLPVLMLTSFFGPASAGFYSLGRTVLAIPSQLIGKSVGDVFYPRISEAANNGENLFKLIKKATLILGIIGIIPFGLIIAFGPALFSFIFGPEWKEAGGYARWIALWVLFVFMNGPSIKALPVLSAQAFHLKFTTFGLIIRLIALSIGYFIFMSDYVAIAIYGIVGSILNIYLIIKTLKKANQFDKTVDKFNTI
ncbi:lipopolysaccharide biosynthesis protein [Bacillus sp. 7894-2]|uniref:lipopolysaccharide biosynthesis protein n=1 Tax=Bacillus sp. 7894-2 TaxID=2021695 RepID=UPI000BA62A15|nr:lipopolysaccharide biosynthesis protein [Bacillus sp. 7894-2]PAE25790.1 polysaccharide biosynthesis protein [Bacillus sp. 7894-2]